jgi:hypothetical protein
MRARAVIFGFVVAMAPVLAHAELADCSCKDFDKLQQELENAVTLRDRHQAKADEMEQRLNKGESKDEIAKDYENWEKHIAGNGIVSTTTSDSVAIQYIPHGDAINIMKQISGWTSPVTKLGYTMDQYDATKAHAIEKDYKEKNPKKDLCDFENPEAVKSGAEGTSFCKAVRDILIAHENNHQKTCQTMGYIAFWGRSIDEVARDEVNAYNKQIEALEKEIAKSLKGAEIQFESSSTLNYSAQMVNFQYSHTVAPTKGKIPDNDGKTWSVNLKGAHKTVADKISIGGMSCSMPTFTRDVDLSVAASGKQATITFISFAPTKVGIKCPYGSGGSGAGMSPDQSGESHVMPLKLSSSHSEDASKSRAAEMLKGTMKVSGTVQSKLSIICPQANK